MHPLDVPTVDPSTAVPFLAMMATKNHNGDAGDDEGDAIATLARKWGHGIVTTVLAAFCGFLWTQYQESSRDRTRMQTDVEVLKRDISELRGANTAQDNAHLAAIKALTDRLDAQRTSIETLQHELFAHASRDDTMYQRKPGR